MLHDRFPVLHHDFRIAFPGSHTCAAYPMHPPRFVQVLQSFFRPPEPRYRRSGYENMGTWSSHADCAIRSNDLGIRIYTMHLGHGRG